MRSIKLGLLVAFFATTAFSHMFITSPCPRYTTKGENCPAIPNGLLEDYNIASPISPNEKPVCKHKVPYSTPSATWTAGQSITVKFGGSAPHSGGHCEYSLSYDGGNTFVVVHQVLRRCFGDDNQRREYTFTLPAEVPASSKAVFAWSWVNASGNREFYMNCADVVIKSNSKSFTGKKMTVANLDGFTRLPEFGLNYDTGLDLYKKAATITVTGNGESNIAEPKNDEQVLQPEEPEKPTSSSVVSIVKPTISGEGNDVDLDGGPYVFQFLPDGDVGPGQENNKPEDKPDDKKPDGNKPVEYKPVARAGCAIGTFRCGSDTSKFDTCDNLGWVSRPCAPGTVCRISSPESNPCQFP